MNKRWMWGVPVLFLVLISAYWLRPTEGEQILQSQSQQKQEPASAVAVPPKAPVVEKANSSVQKEQARTPQAAATGREEYRDLSDLRQAFGSGWNAIKGEMNGRQEVRSILVSEATMPTLNNDNVLDFVQKIRPVFGAAKAELVQRPSEDRPHQFDFDQTLQGYEVYGGRVRVITDPANSTPVIINNDLKPVESFNDSVVITANAAEEAIQKSILDSVQAMELKAQEKPVLFHTQGNKGQLSWVVHVKWIKDRRLHAKDFLVSAEDGKILFERNLLDH